MRPNKPPHHRSHRPQPWWATAILAVMGLGLPAQAEIVDIRFDAERRFTHRFEVAAGKFAEACGQIPRGSAVQWRFQASAPMNFNIHYHEGKAVTYPEKREGRAQGAGTLQVTVDEAYCWMWTNKTGQSAAVTVELQR